MWTGGGHSRPRALVIQQIRIHLMPTVQRCAEETPVGIASPVEIGTDKQV